jgi:hypothetical protein
MCTTGGRVFYDDVILDIFGGDGDEEEEVIKFDRVSAATLERVLDRRGCELVQDPTSKDWVGFDCIKLQDNILLKALREFIPLDRRVSPLPV